MEKIAGKLRKRQGTKLWELRIIRLLLIGLGPKHVTTRLARERNEESPKLGDKKQET